MTINILAGKRIVVCHAGSASNPKQFDGPQRACEAGLKSLAQRNSALDAVISATQVLEDDERFNAGTGSNLRLDGKTIQMDASCMTSAGEFAGVAIIERVKNPVAVARCLLGSPNILLAGEGATAFARRSGFDDFDPTTAGAKNRLKKIMTVANKIGEWSYAELEQAWNYKISLREAFGGDTVGSVSWDGQTFASALSSGGTTAVLLGRVGDVPLPGCGLYAGENGAVAATGDGEYIAKNLLAYRAYVELEKGKTPEQTVQWALAQFPESVDIGIIVINKTDFAGGARHGMAWHGLCQEIDT